MNRDKVIEERALLLARVVLTRREDVAPLSFQTGDLDLFASITGEPATGFGGFGVMVWGTEKPLLNESDATKHLRLRWKQKHKEDASPTTYSIPVIVLLFSMQNDDAYYAWITKPCLDKGTPRLEMNENLEASKFDKRSLDHVVNRVKAWYESLFAMLHVPQHASHCAE